MLRLLQKSTDNRGLTRTGVYSLVIAPTSGRVIDLDNKELEFIFRPNPTDIDDAMNFPNVILPDHSDGFYVDVNEIGVKTISIRGTTGNYPMRSMLDTAINALPGTSPTNLFGRGSPAAMVQQAAGKAPLDGYNIWVSLMNFFVRWTELARSRPYAYAMVFKNTKDAELYQVLPLAFRKMRTAGRPTLYGYAIELQVVSEQTYTPPRKTWMEQINDLRSQVRQWRYAINRTILIASELLQDVVLGSLTRTFSPVVQGLSSMTQGLQSLSYVAGAIERNAAYSPERVKDVVNELFKFEWQTNARTPGTTVSSPAYPQGSIDRLVPPDSDSIRDVYAPMLGLYDYYTGLFSQRQYGTGERSDLNLDDPLIDDHGHALMLLQLGYIAADNAPLASDPIRATAGLSTRDMHATARAATASVLDGRENELASASLAADTVMIDDTTLSTSTRHAASQARSLEAFTLSRLAASILGDWVQSNNERVSPALSTFRDWYLGMRDPDVLSPTYKTVNVAIHDTIYSLAQKHLGSWERWAEIALINGLTYPYISPQGGLYQKAPGEPLYIPVETADMPVSIIESIKEITRTHDRVSAQDVFVGFDVELSILSGDMTYAVYDVGHVVGHQAFMQEFCMVLEGQGGVTPDRLDGPIFRIGTKSAGRTTLEFWHSMMRQWLLSDRRVANLDWLKVWQDGGAVYFSMSIQFQNYDSTVTLAGELRV